MMSTGSLGFPSRNVAAMAAILTTLALPAAADEPASAALDKLGRGVAGLTLGVLELPASIAEETRENGAFSGATVGFAVGLGRFVTRELVGLTQVLTAPLADAPPGIEGAVASAYPWDSFVGAPEGVALEQQKEELGWIRGIQVEERDTVLQVRFPGDLLFDVGSPVLSESARPRLYGLAETLQHHPETEVLIVGHADATGSEARNREISLHRAEAVRAYLVTQGIAPARIETRGVGAEVPLASNDTPEGRRANRRVEFLLRTFVASGSD